VQLQLLQKQLRIQLQKRQDELSIICRHAISQCNDSLLNALISFHICMYWPSNLLLRRLFCFWFMQTKTNLLHTRTPHTYSTYTHTHLHTYTHKRTYSFRKFDEMKEKACKFLGSKKVSFLPKYDTLSICGTHLLSNCIKKYSGLKIYRTLL